MAFTYNLKGEGDTLVIADIRLALGDTIENNGPKPDGSNFSDDEVLSAYSSEGDHVRRAVALLLESLANAWSGVPSTILVNSISVDTARTAKHFADRAEWLRKLYGTYGNNPVNVQLQRATSDD